MHHVSKETRADLHSGAASLVPLVPRSLNVLLDVTNKCNLKCRMCYFSYDEVFDRRAIYMSPEAFEVVAREVFPWAGMVVLSAGSEPLVHPDFAGLLEIAKPYRPPSFKFLTNGQLLTPEIAEAVIRCGVTEIHVSIDGATRETYEWVRRGGSFDRLVKNLEMLTQLKTDLKSQTPVLQFNVTLMRCNVDELGEFARLARRLGVDQLSCRHLLPYEGLGMEDQLLVKDRDGANRALAKGLDEAAAEGIRVVMFPDFFEKESRQSAPWSKKTGAEMVARHVGFEMRTAEAFSVSSAVQVETSSGEKKNDFKGHVERKEKTGSGHRESPAELLAPPRPPREERRRGDRPWKVRKQLANYLQGSRWGRWLHQVWGFSRGHGAFKEPLVPFGWVDHPANGTVRVREDLELSGWALYRPGLDRVAVYREPLPQEQAESLGGVLVGEARRLNGARPDVAAQYAGHPEAMQAAWSFQLRTRDLPQIGNEHHLTVVAWGRDGQHGVIGKRRVLIDREALDTHSVYCRKPFTSVYINAGAEVYPYPDCQTVEPFGELTRGTSFPELWYGEAFTELRRRILEVDPPAMCRGCPDFVNRNPDDPDYFMPKHLEHRLPTGYIDGRGTFTSDDVTVSGWVVGFSPVVRVEIVRDPLLGETGDQGREDGLVYWGDAQLGVPRPDIAKAFPFYSGSATAGWCAKLLTGILPAGTTEVTLRALAYNQGGAVVEIGMVELKLASAGQPPVLREA